MYWLTVAERLYSYLQIPHSWKLYGKYCSSCKVSLSRWPDITDTQQVCAEVQDNIEAREEFLQTYVMNSKEASDDIRLDWISVPLWGLARSIQPCFQDFTTAPVHPVNWVGRNVTACWASLSPNVLSKSVAPWSHVSMAKTNSHPFTLCFFWQQDGSGASCHLSLPLQAGNWVSICLAWPWRSHNIRVISGHL